MKIYLAGTSVSNPPDEPKLQDLFKRGHKLHSFYHIPLLEKKWFETNMKNKVKLFLDSGAFSAWTQKTEINIDDYIQFIKDNRESIKIYANLDVIGINGEQPGRETAAATYGNQLVMEEAGLHPIPCFHFGEPMEYLKYYVAHYNYIALGVAGVKGTQLYPWLNECFLDYICDDEGFPKAKVHGFAVTSLRVMLKYPWYSVDSTSWVVTSRMGGIFIPKFNGGKYLYDEQPWKIMVSSRSPKKDTKDVHIDNVSVEQKKIYLDYIHSKGYTIGKSEFIEKPQSYEPKENEKWSSKKPKDKSSLRELEIIVEPGLCNTYQLRDELNIIYFLDLEMHRPKWPWPFKVKDIQGNLGLNKIE